MLQRPVWSCVKALVPDLHHRMDGGLGRRVRYTGEVRPGGTEESRQCWSVEERGGLET